MIIQAPSTVDIATDRRDGLVHHLSPPESKIALFRSLFRGRDDVYPRRFESRKTGKSGYSPACGNEWVRACAKSPGSNARHARTNAFCPSPTTLFAGTFLARTTPAATSSWAFIRCCATKPASSWRPTWTKTHWQEDARAILETCRRLDLPAALERSRSGNGGHIWLFFDEAIPATLARKLGAHLLTETMERRPGIGLDSYDRFFPNQDTLPQGGFGNLIALPLQKRPRECGNSVFLDDGFVPHADQWAFLSSIRKIDRATVERIVC